LRRERPSLRLAVVAGGLLAGAAVSHAAETTVSYSEPTLDRWNYSFNFTPGVRGSASVFGSQPEPAFDDRDGQVMLGYDTFDDVTPGLGLGGYRVISAQLVIMVESDFWFDYDPTPDPWNSYIVDESDPLWIPDPDDGRPVEMFGCGFRNGWTLLTFQEVSPFCDGCDCFVDCVDVRNVYPIDFVDGQPRDISQSLTDEFDPQSFAVGQFAELSPGDSVPTRSDMIFDLDVNDPVVQCYLRDGLDQGRVDLMLSSLHFTVQGGSGTFPVFFMKENIDVPTTALPARLSLTVDIIDGGSPVSGDVNGDGLVNVDDLTAVILGWGPCPCCPADLDGNGVVDVDDLTAVILGWSP
jgi:hypothetical protein